MTYHKIILKKNKFGTLFVRSFNSWCIFKSWLKMSFVFGFSSIVWLAVSHSDWSLWSWPDLDFCGWILSSVFWCVIKLLLSGRSFNCRLVRQGHQPKDVTLNADQRAAPTSTSSSSSLSNFRDASSSRSVTPHPFVSSSLKKSHNVCSARNA